MTPVKIMLIIKSLGWISLSLLLVSLYLLTENKGDIYTLETGHAGYFRPCGLL